MGKTAITTEKRTFMRILMIEDDELLSESVKMLLEKHGFQADQAFDGETGIEYALTETMKLAGDDPSLQLIQGLQCKTADVPSVRIDWKE